MAADELTAALATALNGLTEHQRFVFTARADGFSYAEIGRMLGGRNWSSVWRAQKAAESKIAQALLPLLYESMRQAAA